MKDYNSNMAINVGDDKVKMVNMGSCSILIEEQEHLLTYGLGPCVAVAIVLKEKEGKIIRLLSHIDMGQIIGITFDQFRNKLRQLKSVINSEIQCINISLISTQSYNNIKHLSENENKLLAIILKEFKNFGITSKNIKFNCSSQVQISPCGNISTYTEGQLQAHRKNMLQNCLQSFGGYVEPDLNIYITNYGAYMGNCLLGINSSETEKIKLLSNEYYQYYISKGYKLVVAPSFNNLDHLAVYVTNWNDSNIQEYWTVPGCIQASKDDINFLRKNSS